MATESLVRLVESSGLRKGSSSKDITTFPFRLDNLASEELELLLKGPRYNEMQRKEGPNRSGSAPPSMEGSLAAIGNLLAQQDSSINLASISRAIDNCETEEQLRSDPAYIAYYCANVNLNPRLPPPLISRENRRLAQHIGGFGSSWKPTSYDDTGDGSFRSRGFLSTHTEEPEDERSPRLGSDDWVESDTSAFTNWKKEASLSGRHKSLVDLIQEDFPRTPSPVYKSHALNQAAAEELIDSDRHAMSLNDSSSSSNVSGLPESSSGSVEEGNTYSADVNSQGLPYNIDSSASSVSRLFDGSGNLPPPQRDEPRARSADFDNNEINSIASQLDYAVLENRAKSANLSDLQVAENSKSKQERQHMYEKVMQQSHLSLQHGNSNQIQGVQVQLNPRGSASSAHTQPRLSTVGIQPAYHSLSLAAPFYASPAAYMNPGSPYYTNIQSSGLFAPQFNMGGYAMSSAIYPPYIAGYHSHGAGSHFDAISNPGFGLRAGIGEGTPQSGDMQQPNKFYGHFYGQQQALMLQSPLINPTHIPYFQHSYDSVYGNGNQYGQVPSSSVIGSQAEAFVSPKESMLAAYLEDQRFKLPGNGSLNIPNPRAGVITGSSYYGTTPNMGFMPQFQASPLGSPVMPGSPLTRPNSSGRRNELKFQSGSGRSAGAYSAWQGPRGDSNFDESRKLSFLEELKTSSSRKFELSDIAGCIIEFSVDQHGSRFIQQKLENCSEEEKAAVFREVIPHAARLMTDVFGNYVIQKFFEYGSAAQRKELGDQLAGQILPLSLQMYGCRVIQKALEVIDIEQKTQLLHELDGHVMRCVRDQNGNHVIQKCIECIPLEKIGFIISSFQGQVATLSTHPYGCRVIQRVLEHCSDERQSQCIVDEILESALDLAQDQYGNYVTQHVLERGRLHERKQIISKLTGRVVQMSQHKYASNVVEKCLEHGDAADREQLIDEIIGQPGEADNLLVMMKDQFANYVVQKILETSTDRQRKILLNRITVHLNALKKYTYGKHIVARFEQLCSEESQGVEPVEA